VPLTGLRGSTTGCAQGGESVLLQTKGWRSVSLRKEERAPRRAFSTGCSEGLKAEAQAVGGPEARVRSHSLALRTRARTGTGAEPAAAPTTGLRRERIVCDTQD